MSAPTFWGTASLWLLIGGALQLFADEILNSWQYLGGKLISRVRPHATDLIEITFHPVKLAAVTFVGRVRQQLGHRDGRVLAPELVCRGLTTAEHARLYPVTVDVSSRDSSTSPFPPRTPYQPPGCPRQRDDQQRYPDRYKDLAHGSRAVAHVRFPARFERSGLTGRTFDNWAMAVALGPPHGRSMSQPLSEFSELLSKGVFVVRGDRLCPACVNVEVADDVAGQTGVEACQIGNERRVVAPACVTWH
jgi:hypothetical protein